MKRFAATLLMGLLLPQSVRADDVRAMLQRYCHECHNAERAEAELDLATLFSGPSLSGGAGRRLSDIIQAVAEKDMPPRKAKLKLDDGDRGRMVSLLQAQLASLAQRLRDDPGHVVIVRLSRGEYRNVMRDLSGGQVTDAGRYLPNEGGAGEGFSNVGEAQSMTPALLEKHLEAARDALRYLRVWPGEGLVWHDHRLDAVDTPAEARRDAVDALLAWHIAQQEKWGRVHREQLEAALGFSDAAYLEAAWRYRWRQQRSASEASFADIAHGYEQPLGPVVLEKWWHILNSEKPPAPFEAWAAAWKKLPPPAEMSDAELRRRCIEITRGATKTASGDDFAPPYEISYHETKEEVLAAAKEGRWPFRVAIGDAKELFLVMTDAGDGARGEYALWRQGRVHFADGSVRPWQEVVKLRGANSGKEFAWGVDAEGTAIVGDSVGVRPPGALKFTVPPGATMLEVEAVIDRSRTTAASLQAIILREKPASQSYIPGRRVFGGKPAGSREAKQDEQTRQLTRALRRRNVSEANITKVGLSAERNVLADWPEADMRYIGGPWPTQPEDREEPGYPYHLTVAQVRRNATPEDLRELQRLKARLEAVKQAAQQDLVTVWREAGWEQPREGASPPVNVASNLTDARRKIVEDLTRRIDDDERRTAAEVQQVLTHFAGRAWRRPVADDEMSPLMSLYRDARSQGLSYDASVKQALLAILASPHFLYRGAASVAAADSPSVAASVQPLAPLDLASRLSFFLWGSIPDDTLLQKAQQGRLHGTGLTDQARRMLRDPRAASLALDFAAQLLHFSDFDSFTGPDASRFPEFTPELRAAMLGEVVHFLTDCVREDRPLLDLIDGRHTFMNAALAGHYGVSGVEGPEFRRVAVPPQRGGLSGMALFLTKTSLPLRTSPVQRGVWVLEQLLGRELPNPPADVQPISADEKNDKGLSIRQQLELHRASSTCASCHDKIDPLGISLESFDGIGRWRTALHSGEAIEASATTHDGRHLAGPAGLRRYLLERQDEFFRHFNRKLLGYALGRAVGPGDAALLDRMHEALVTHEHRLSAVVEVIVASPQFTQRRAAPPQAQTEATSP